MVRHMAFAAAFFLIAVLTTPGPAAHALDYSFCLPAATLQQQGANTSGMTSVTVNGTAMLCSTAAPAGLQNCTNSCTSTQFMGPGCVCTDRSAGLPPANTSAQTSQQPTTGNTPTSNTCPKAGERPAATQADLDSMKANGYPTELIHIGSCWDPTSPYVGQTTGEAKQYLRSILCKNSNFGGAGPDGTIQQLDSKFAVCAAKFLKAASTKVSGQLPLYDGGTNSVCVREGYRTPEQQNKYYQEYLRGGGIACGKGAGCEHPRSIAIDVNTAGNYETLWNMAPQFGVNFYLRSRDAVHFVPTTNECSNSGTGPAGSLLPSSTYDFDSNGNPNTSSSSSNLLNGITSALAGALRSLFGTQQQLPQYAPYISPSTAQTTSGATYDQSTGAQTNTDQLNGTSADTSSGTDTSWTGSVGTTSVYAGTQASTDYSGGNSASTTALTQLSNTGQNDSGTSSGSFLNNFIDSIRDTLFPDSGQQSSDVSGEPAAFNVNVENGTEVGSISNGRSPVSYLSGVNDAGDTGGAKATHVSSNGNNQTNTGDIGANGPQKQEFPSEGSNTYTSGAVAIDRPSSASQTFDEYAGSGQQSKYGAAGVNAERDQSQFIADLKKQYSLLQALILLVQPFRGNNPHAPQQNAGME